MTKQLSWDLAILERFVTCEKKAYLDMDISVVGLSEGEYLIYSNIVKSWNDKTNGLKDIHKRLYVQGLVEWGELNGTAKEIIKKRIFMYNKLFPDKGDAIYYLINKIGVALKKILLQSTDESG